MELYLEVVSEVGEPENKISARFCHHHDRELYFLFVVNF